MLNTSTALSVIVLGLVIVARGVKGSTNIEIDIDIDAPDDYVGEDCNSAKQAKFKKVLDRSVASKFQNYYGSLAALYKVDNPGQACYYSEDEGRRRELDELVTGDFDEEDHRELNALKKKPTFGYTFRATFKCRFCDLRVRMRCTKEQLRIWATDSDSDQRRRRALGQEGGEAGVDMSAIKEDAAKLKAKLQRQLVGALTQKVNNNEKSCLKGSGSAVFVSIVENADTPSSHSNDALVCPENFWE